MSEQPVVAALSTTTEVLIKCLRALGQNGQPDAASRLAAKAWWALKDVSPRDAERVNGAMHFLARLDPEPDAPTIGAPASGAGLTSTTQEEA
ncbi:MAG: hypothetical protein Q4P07_00265 [Ornithinimicrobium sp.]|uniref:hypothetical protein n=1 Tax=Ornithinimicrobium sp. TaxID=1977084 RepID=UPI0026E04A39|nr:hypothetical protein [Ornithinimicrobium sp.]MDO5738563.1 hypothetical protein [Ornithinimicrobium sp.]